MPRVGAGQPTLDAVTWQTRSEVIVAAFLELIIGASLPLRSADAAAWDSSTWLHLRTGCHHATPLV